MLHAVSNNTFQLSYKTTCVILSHVRRLISIAINRVNAIYYHTQLKLTDKGFSIKVIAVCCNVALTMATQNKFERGIIYNLGSKTKPKVTQK